jgi:ATP-dependent 26S proteasome regulatory subunit
MPPFGFNSSDGSNAPRLRTGRRVSDTSGAYLGLGGQKHLLIGIGVLVATWWLMGLLGANRFAALGVSVAGLLLLPQPTPQFVLFASRMTVAVTGAMCLTIATGWPSSVFPGSANQWDKSMALPFWLGCGALLLWPFSTFMRRKGQEETPGTANDSNDDEWAQVPAIRFDDVGGFNQQKTLEPALIRDGRFDAKLRLDLPDEQGRKEVLLSLLKETRWRSHELSRIIRRTVGWSPARLKAMVDRSVLLSKGQPLSEERLLATIESIGGNDRPNLDPVHWDDVVLPADVIDEIKSLIRLMEPGESERLSIPPPTGLILVGAPGTGKTMTARLIASQVRRSFYAITPGEVLSGEVGGSVKRLKEVFARAKENAPSVLFFDEMDGLFPAPSIATGQHDIQLVEQGLIEISQLRPEHNVFLIGTSNYLERIDPRILRGGRFSEKLHIGLPDDAGYQKLIARYLGNARLDPNLEIGLVIDRVRELTPADLEATIQGMKRLAMSRMTSQHAALPPLNLEDLEQALSRVRPPV